MRRALQAFRRDQSGAVAVEFVLIAPILFALLFGIVVMGYFMGLSHSVKQLAAGAARASVAGLDAAERTSLASAYIAAAGERYPLLVPASVSADIEVAGGAEAAITVNVTYAIGGSILEIANGLLNLGLTDLQERAYLAY